MLRQHSVGSNITFEELIGRMHVTFFTNWYDNTNFPHIYGSGILIPQLDANGKFIIYLSGNSIHLGTYTNSAGITWTKL